MFKKTRVEKRDIWYTLVIDYFQFRVMNNEITIGTIDSDSKITDKTKKMRIGFYIRVSTQEQEDEGYSPEFQLEQLEEHVQRKAYKNWYTKKEWHFSDVKSGGEKLERLELQKLMNLVRKKEIDLVLVWRIDRLSRKLSDLLEIFEEMDKYDVGFASVKEDLDFTGPIGKLIFQIFGALAEFERENIRMRTGEGKRQSAKQGNWIGGAISYGYCAPEKKGIKGRKLQVVPEERKIVRQIFEWFVIDGCTPTWIAKELNRMGVPKGIGNPAVQGTKWRSEGITRMMSNEIYRGMYITNRWKCVSKKPEKWEERPEQDWHIHHVEPCIDDSLFYMAQNRLKDEYNRGKSRGGGKETYMLRGKLIDIAIRRGFVGYKATKGQKNYRRKKCEIDGTVYPTISVSAKIIEDFVWKHIELALMNPKKFLQAHNERSNDQKLKRDLQKRLQFYEVRVVKANERITKVKEAFYANIISESEAQEEQEKSTNKQSEALNKKREIEVELSQLAQYDNACIDLERFAKKFEKRIKKLSYKEKQTLVDLLVERIEITETDDERIARVLFRFDPKAITKATPVGRNDISQGNGKNPPSKGGKTQEMVGREGFEPPKSETSGLQPDPFGHFGTDPNVITRRF